MAYTLHCAVTKTSKSSLYPEGHDRQQVTHAGKITAVT